MFARTERLLLRPGWAEDAPALARAIADETVVRNLATAPWPYALEDAEAFLAAPRDPAMPCFLITERTDGEPRIVRLETDRLYDPIEDGGFFRSLISRLQLHLSIGEAF